MRALLDALTAPAGPVQVTGDIAWRRRPALYREHALFVTVSPDQAREQLACGARVIMADRRAVLVREQIAAAAAERALTAAEAFGRCGRSSPRTPPRCGWPALASLSGLPGAPGHRAADRGAGPGPRCRRGRRPGRQPAPAAHRARRAGRGGRRPARGVRRGVLPRGHRGARRPGRPGHGDHGCCRAAGSGRRLRLALARGAGGALAVGGAVAGRTANTTRPTCSTWPARGSARRPTRSVTPGPATRT